MQRTGEKIVSTHLAAVPNLRSASWLERLTTMVLLVGFSASCDGSVSGTLSTLPLEVAQPIADASPDDVPGNGSTSPGDASVIPPDAGTEAPSGPYANTCVNSAARCRQPVASSEPLPGRRLPPIEQQFVEKVAVGTIWGSFARSCGRCHAPPRTPDASNGGWVVSGIDGLMQDSRVGNPLLESLTTTDPELAMPPGRDVNRPLSGRLEELLGHMEAWVVNGRSEEGYEQVFDADPHPPYRQPEILKQKATAIGSCIPEPELVGCAAADAVAIDRRFETIRDGDQGGFRDLPRRLRDTDLVSLDSVRLAELGVVSYAPTYTLFSDNAKKSRYVRVPVGKKIRYDAATGEMEIPDNTRFYKTFLRKVGDENGEPQYRKIETRIIVVRNTPEAGAEIRAIFGTYKWSLDESWAQLVEEPYEDGRPFKDIVVRHIVDEARALAENPLFDPDHSAGVAAAFERDVQVRSAALSKGQDVNGLLLTRGYAIPGWDRCIQCHMGRKSFILGFSPEQVDRRAGVEGGVYAEVAQADELSQLRRFVEYGLLDISEALQTDTAQPELVFALEDSQVDKLTGIGRRPRNKHELQAQGYMVGNCAFCHNPRGFPSVENPALKSVLNFYPGRTKGEGIFDFPIDRVSPRTLQGDNFDVPYPYVTPSLFARDGRMSTRVRLADDSDATVVLMVAPWRSLLYRNVQTAFTYSADQAIHPHMPMNVPGYDCLAQEIFGKWMLSIPARLKTVANTRGEPQLVENNPQEREAQPWQEVRPDEENFESYLTAASQRVAEFLNDQSIHVVDGSSPAELLDLGQPDNIQFARAYLGAAKFCADTADVQAIEMMFTDASGAVHDAPRDDLLFIVGATSQQPLTVTRHLASLSVDQQTRRGQLLDGIPDRTHWVERDLTVAQGVWVPRRSDWQAAFADQDAFLPVREQLTYEQQTERADLLLRLSNAERVYSLLQEVELTDELKRFSLTDFPYGYWSQKGRTKHALGEEKRCDEALAAADPISSFLQEQRPHWMARATDQDALVYAQPPGEIIFDLICANCHGADANADSLLAGTILELSGGATRVANLRDGLFGALGANLEDVFGDAETAAKYVVWMGLGGTQLVIPSVVLSRVGRTQPLGVTREVNPNAQATANMLDNAVGFCKDSLGVATGLDGTSLEFSLKQGFPEYDEQEEPHRTSLVAKNGDAEVWLRLCSMNNTPPIRAVRYRPDPDDHQATFVLQGQYWADVGGQSLVVDGELLGTAGGELAVGLQSDNWLPWCILRPEEEDIPGLENEWLEQRSEPVEQIPYCPSPLLAETDGVQLQKVYPLTEKDERRDTWATRGAMNVGLSVFHYLNALARGEIERKPAYDACALGAE